MRRIKTKYIIEVLIHLAFWTGVYYTLTSLTSSTILMQITHNDGRDVEKMAMNSILANARLSLIFLALLFYGNIFWILKKVICYRRSPAGIAIAVGWFVLTFAAQYFFVGPKPNHVGPPPSQMRFKISDREVVVRQKATLNANAPLKLSVPDTGEVKKGPLMRIVPDPPFFFVGDNDLHAQLTMLLIFLVVAGLSIAYFFLKEWARNELARNQLAAYQLNTEIKFLKSQINPHFLFNTLNNLFSIAQEKGNDELADGISKLSGMMRYMIYDSNEENVPLQKEIAYIKDCIQLNKLRYADDEVSVIFDYPAETGSVVITPMLFIPFVENAFKHGVAISQTSAIKITLSLWGQTLIFTCENPDYSAVRKMTEEKSGIGLENVRRRLDLLYPGRYKLLLSDEGGRYKVKLEIELE